MTNTSNNDSLAHLKYQTLLSSHETRSMSSKIDSHNHIIITYLIVLCISSSDLDNFIHNYIAK